MTFKPGKSPFGFLTTHQGFPRLDDLITLSKLHRVQYVIIGRCIVDVGSYIKKRAEGFSRRSPVEFSVDGDCYSGPAPSFDVVIADAARSQFKDDAAACGIDAPYFSDESIDLLRSNGSYTVDSAVKMSVDYAVLRIRGDGVGAVERRETTRICHWAAAFGLWDAGL